MARPKVHDDDTRDALLRAAGLRLAAHGIDAVTVRGVAADADVTTRAVYAVFGSRTGMLRAMFNDGFAAFAEVLDGIPDTDDPLHDMFALGLAYGRSARDRPYLYDVMFVVDSAQFSPTADDVALSLRTVGRLRDAVVRCLDAGIYAGDVDAITLQAWATVHGLVMLEKRGFLGPASDAIWEQSLHCLARGWAPVES
ncbi:TetR/AcrR family transcriptional regulator [Antrihabitans stalactiti]|uniref:TetR/AcrR family transcriptional regulator n=1 Tax=Antrihabitans stalactiti TaxID=2584121 RepID=A0A848KMZ0_9NOCA|nr:TetR/AcrR family transcriptional regulator [Antrihabitans stalactiti]NMN99246.1 TetR/AcrR family transcriptional regulator [Antrihabitans stalactiti]